MRFACLSTCGESEVFKLPLAAINIIYHLFRIAKWNSQWILQVENKTGIVDILLFAKLDWS
jgi:hypothetical protein